MAEYEQYFDPNLGIDTVVLNCNTLALDYIKSEDFNQAIQLLHRANRTISQHSDTESYYKLRAITLNNLGCLYKRLSQYDKALTFLNEALDYEQKLREDELTMSGTHLNICAIQSFLGEHEKALAHAICAMDLLKKDSNLSSNKAMTLIIAYNNAATEYETLGQSEESAKMFYEGWEYSVQYLGRAHELTKSMLQACSGNSPTKVVRRRKLPSHHNSRTYLAKPIFTPDFRTKSKSNVPEKTLNREDFTKHKLPDINRNKIKYDSRIHFIGEKIQDLRKKIDHFDSDYQRTTDLGPMFSFYSKRRQDAARKIQKVFRGFLVRRKLTFKHRKKAKHHVSKNMIAYSVIYSKVIGYYSKTFTRELRSILNILRAFKGWYVRRVGKENLVSEYIKLVLNTSAGINKKKEILGVVVKIQSRARSFVASRKYKRMRMNTIENCLVVQKALRTKFQIDFKRDYETKVFDASFVIQRVLRKFIDSEIKENLWRDKVQGQLIIGKFHRKWKAKKTVKLYREKLHRLSTVIQTQFRNILANETYANRLDQQQQVSLRLQKYYRAKIGKQKALSYNKVLNSFSTTLQSLFRRAEAIEEYKKISTKLTSLSLLIQKVFKRKEGHFKYKQYQKTVDQCSTMIQSRFLTFLNTRMVALKRNIRNRSSVNIQKYVRRNTGIKKFNSFKGRVIANSLKIQALFRGFVDKKEYQLAKYVQSKSALIIQNFLKTIKQREKFLEMKNAALMIQRCFRGYKARSFFENYRNFIDDLFIQHESEILYSDKSEEHLEFPSHTLKEPPILNNLIKKLSLNAEDNLGEPMNNTGSRALIQDLVLIQSRMRGFITRKYFKPPEYHKKLQRLARNFLFKRRLKRRHYVKKVQSEFRGFLVRLKYENKALWPAAKIIQSKFRGFLVRSSNNPISRIIKIQAAARRMRSLKIVKLNFAVRSLQEHFRRFLIYKDIRRHVSCTRIQVIFRRFIARKVDLKNRVIKELKEKLNEQMRRKAIIKFRAATQIQANFRAYLTRKMYLQVRNAATTIAKNYKMVQIRRIYTSILNAVIFIQAAYRSFKRRSLKLKYIDEDAFYISSRRRF